MRLLVAIAAIPVAFALSLCSVPWVLLAMGYVTIGDEDAADRIMETCPLSWWSNWLEAR